jgi:amino acid adenylation domain-containing protein
MTLLTAFKILLQRHSGQDDIAVGSPIANRNRAEVEPLIGLFLNTLVLRTDLSNNPTFRELLGRVREVCLGAYTHQDLPFEKLVEELHPERDLSRHPLFDVLFNFDEPSSWSLNLHGLTITQPDLLEPLAKFSMTLYAGERQGQLSLRLVYQKALFSDERMRCFLEQFEYLLEQIVAAPEKPIRDYSLVTLHSRSVLPDPSLVLAEPKQQLVTELFSVWVGKTPDRPAMNQGDRTWSYGELAQRAESLASVLAARGIKKGEVVAVHGSRSLGLIGSVLGVLLSGGALLLIDPNLPDRRKQLMLRQAGAKMLLKIGRAEAEESWLNEESDLNVLTLGASDGCMTDEKHLAFQPVSLAELSPEDAAYVFFTSGTTGVPKAILGCHKGLSHFIQWQRETFAIGPEDRVAQLTNLSFDPVLREIFLPLSSGATLCLPQETESFGGDDTLGWLERERITVLHTVPTLAQSWLADGGAGVCLKSLRWVFFAGEPLTENLVRRWRARFPQSGAEIVNLYGPTETTLAKCFYRVPALVTPGVQPVGRPLPQTQALVLRENGQLCGIGEAGEIVLRTPFRTLGYVNAPEGHRKRFIKNSFRDDEQDLLYCTGDRGRYRPDGVLEILGRADDQVKVRGVRVEPDEVSAILSQHPALKECVVLANKDEEDQAYLAAYVVAASDRRVTASELRGFLSEGLPSAMVPRAFAFLDELPRTPNGKLDRRALPAPEWRIADLEASYVAPGDAVEVQLTRIWEDVIRRTPIGRRDDFFEVGGHSLLAVQIIDRVKKVFGRTVSVKAIFQAPTIEQFAQVLREQNPLRDWASLVPLQPNGSKPPFFFLAGRSHFGDRLGSDQPVYRVVYQDLDREHPFVRIEDMAAHSIQSVRKIQPNGPYYLGGHAVGGLVAFEMAQQFRRQGEKVGLLALCECRGPHSKRPNSKRMSTDRLWQKASYYLRRVERVGPKRAFTDIFLALRKKTQELAHLEQPIEPTLAEQQASTAIVEARRHYLPQPYPGRIVLVRCAERPAWRDDESLDGWSGLATNGVEMYEVPGEHASIYREPYVGMLTEILRDVLHGAQAEMGNERTSLAEENESLRVSRSLGGSQGSRKDNKNPRHDSQSIWESLPGR